MCRLAYIPKPFKGMDNWLNQMELSFGGDGIGLACPGGLFKSVELTAIQSSQLIDSGSGPYLWHSRRVSSGPRITNLCHPFPCDGGWIAHNGHWQAGATAADALGIISGCAMSDTAVFAMLSDKLGFEAAINRYEPPGVWLHMSGEGLLRVWKNGGSLYFHKRKHIFGSEPPVNSHNWESVLDGWYGIGDKPKYQRIAMFFPEPKASWYGISEDGRICCPK